MDRREFLRLTGAAVWPYSRMAVSPTDDGVLRPYGNTATRQSGPLRFELDEQRRWSLLHIGEARTLPVIEQAVVAVAIGDEVVTLADLAEVVTGIRQPPGGEAVVIRGRGAGVYVEVELVSAAAEPRASVRVSLYPDRSLPTIHSVRFLELPEAQVLPGDAPLVGVITGGHTASPARIARVPADPASPPLTSHGEVALTRVERGLALAFDSQGAGMGEVRLAASAVTVVSDWRPARAVRPEGDTVALHLGLAPAGDGLAALATVLAPDSPVDRERLAADTAPAGWSSRYAFSRRVTEADLLANLERCATHFDRRHFRFIALGPGYQRALGDWEPNEGFPHGHRWLTEQVHARGFRAGLWVAPFLVSPQSEIASAHSEWLLRDAEGPITQVIDGGGRAHVLDGAHPEVQKWLYALGRRAVRDWEYDLLDADLLDGAITGGSYHGGVTSAEAYRRGLAALRDGLGTEAFLLAGHAPRQHTTGYANGVRVSGDLEPSWGGAETGARAAGLASPSHRGRWLVDPDCLLARAPLSVDEARAWATVVAMSGGLTFLSDDLAALPAERLTMLQKIFPVAPVAGRPVGAVIEDEDRSPRLAWDSDAVPLTGPWSFRTGDEPSYAARDFDEEAWETIPVPGSGVEVGRAEYAGYAWYRTRFTLPAQALPTAGRTDGQSDSRTVMLHLGRIDGADEAFVNGVKVGETGEFPPSDRRERLTYRRYAIPADMVDWGGENVLALRTYGGGLWNTRRERAADTWVVEGTPGWWTVALINWDAEPRDAAVPLGSLGLRRSRFLAFDVWGEAPLPDVQGTLRATLAPRSALVVGLRAATTQPQVVGTSRHVVQGAVDIAEETWEAATRTLSARSVNLDSRPYAVTVSVPRALRVGRCTSDVPCTVRQLPTGQAVLEWPAGDGRDIAWKLGFTAAPARRG